MTLFTPIEALLGGTILGVASLLLLLFNGRISGISSIISGAFKPLSTLPQWRWVYISGLITAPLVAYPMGYYLPQNIDMAWSSTIFGGLLVGFGSYYGSGCTSGHGICGIGRLSSRSIISTTVFMFIAIITVLITN